MKPYTPLFDDIVQSHGMVAAVIYGYVWRQCQKERGVCDASFKTIADETGLARRTAVTYIKQLVSDGLLIDTTPELNRKPHKYLVQELQQARATHSLDRARDALALGQEMQQTRARDAHKDTYTKGNKEESTAVTRIARYFHETSGKEFTEDQYFKNWLPFIEKWVNAYGETATKDRIKKALDFANGNNEQSKRYTIASPKSLDNILTNLSTNSNGHTNGINQPPVIQPPTDEEQIIFERLLANATKQ